MSQKNTSIAYVARDNVCLIMQFLQFKELMLSSRSVCKQWSKLPLKLCFKPCRMSQVPFVILKQLYHITGLCVKHNVGWCDYYCNRYGRFVEGRIEQLSKQHLLDLINSGVWDDDDNPGLIGDNLYFREVCAPDLKELRFSQHKVASKYNTAKKWIFTPATHIQYQVFIRELRYTIPVSLQELHIKTGENHQFKRLMARLKKNATEDLLVKSHILLIKLEFDSTAIVYQRDNTNSPFTRVVVPDVSSQIPSTTPHPVPQPDIYTSEPILSL